jgi:hypothetical protein
MTTTAIKSNLYPNQGIGNCYVCILKHIEWDKITLITLPSFQQGFSDITCQIFNLAFTFATFTTFWACASSEIFFVHFLMHLPGFVFG